MSIVSMTQYINYCQNYRYFLWVSAIPKKKVSFSSDVARTESKLQNYTYISLWFDEIYFLQINKTDISRVRLVVQIPSTAETKGYRR